MAEQNANSGGGSPLPSTPGSPDLIHGGWYLGEWAGRGMLAVMCYSEKTGYFSERKSTNGNPMSESDIYFKPLHRMSLESDQALASEGLPAATCSLIVLAEKWERLAASWMQVARDRNDDAPDIANRAQARAAIYQDCAEDLRANKQIGK